MPTVLFCLVVPGLASAVPVTQYDDFLPGQMQSGTLLMRMQVGYQIATRMLSGRDSSFTTVFYTGIVGAIVTSIAAPFFWTSPSWLGWGLFVGLGVMGLGAHYCIIKALEYLPASYLAPYEYFALIWAAIMGYVVFGDFPDGIAIAGAAVIVGSGLYIFYRDHREETAKAKLFMTRK